MQTRIPLVFLLGAGVGLLVGYAQWGDVEQRSVAGGGGSREAAPRREDPTLTALPLAEPLPQAVVHQPALPALPPAPVGASAVATSRRPWELAYDGPALEYERAVVLVSQEVSERDIESLLERQYSPGLADLRPALSETQRVEVLEHLRTTSRAHLLAERVETGLRGKLTEEGRIHAVQVQARANRDAMRYIRERILTQEQEAQLPSYWRD